MQTKKVAVLGAGTMGNGIAQVFAQHGHEVTLRDLDKAILDGALGRIGKSLAKLAEKGKVEASVPAATLARIRITTELSECQDADLVVEAVVESLPVKRDLLAELDRSAPKATIFASNTSSISITKLAAATARPDE